MERKTILIGTIGSRGDVQPFLALAVKLKERGFDPVLCAHGEFREFVEVRGIQFEEIGAPITDALQNTPEGKAVLEAGIFTGFSKLKSLMIQLSKVWLTDLSGAIAKHKPKLLVLSTFCAIFSRLLTAQCKLPFIASHTVPATSSSELGPPTLGSGPLPFGFLNRMAWSMGLLIMNNMMNEFEISFVKEHNLDLDLSKIPLDVHGNKTAECILYLYSEQLIHRPSDWSDPRIVITGTVTLHTERNTQELPVSIANFVENAKSSDSPLVYIGLGSMLPIVVGPVNGSKVLSAIATAAIKSGCHVIVSSLGIPNLKLDLTGCGLPEDSLEKRLVLTSDPLPHDLLFPLCSAVVHHGGAGTSHAACRGGAPSIVIPCTANSDQPFWGSALNRIGVAAPPVPLSSVTVSKLLSAFSVVLKPETKQAAADLANAITQEAGEVVATQKIINIYESITKDSKDDKDHS